MPLFCKKEKFLGDNVGNSGPGVRENLKTADFAQTAALLSTSVRQNIDTALARGAGKL